VLFVCTANVCRSPAAELLLRTGLRARLGPAARSIAVRSAGIWASRDRQVEPGTAAALRARGVPATDIAAARSVPLDREAVAGADLILGSTADHVRAVWRLQLAARHRSFTLGELARLTEAVDPDELPADDPAERLRALVSAADGIRERRRPATGPYLTEAYDIADPTDSDLAQRDMVAETAFLVDELLDVVAGPAPRHAMVRSPGLLRRVRRARRGAAPRAVE
jgi:protein-tyrosine-phosphatase